jgi:HAMP domain-containing protein
LIGGTFGGTVLTLVFLPALYAIWFRIEPTTTEREEFATSIPAARVA